MEILNSCSSPNENFDSRWLFSTREAGEKKFVVIGDIDDPNIPSAEYLVTSNNTPYTMERDFVWRDDNGNCTWLYHRTYELEFMSDDHITGIQQTNITSNFSSCEQCAYTTNIEMKRGVYGTIDDAPF